MMVPAFVFHGGHRCHARFKGKPMLIVHGTFTGGVTNETSSFCKMLLVK
jgi:hypothetical protein